MPRYRCENGCCMLEICPYVPNPFYRAGGVRKRKKAGVVIYDPNTNKVLLVQSRGRLWGPPKGTLELGETETECAIREVKEETGLDVNPSMFLKSAVINNRATYYYVELSHCDITVQTQICNNDANGVAWINLKCLNKCVRDNTIKLNNHCLKIFHKFLGDKFNE